MRYNMKKITYFLIALLLCAAFVGTASAWQSNTDAVINPSGNLVPGESVIATMNVVLGKGELDITDSIQFTSPLKSASWTVDVYRVGKTSTDDTTSRRPSGLRKTNVLANSLAHRTTWLRPDF